MKTSLWRRRAGNGAMVGSMSPIGAIAYICILSIVSAPFRAKETKRNRSPLIS